MQSWDLVEMLTLKSTTGEKMNKIGDIVPQLRWHSATADLLYPLGMTL